MTALSEVISTSTKEAKTSELTLTNETVITLYIINKTGTHNKSRATLEYSPGGDVWIRDRHATNGIGFLTVTIAAVKVRAVIIDNEDVLSTADVYIVAR